MFGTFSNMCQGGFEWEIFLDLIIKAFCQRYMENGKSLISKGSIQHPDGKLWMLITLRPEQGDASRYGCPEDNQKRFRWKTAKDPIDLWCVISNWKI